MDMINKFTEISELLVEDAEAGAAAHIEAVEEVRDPLDAPRDQLDVLPVHPVRLQSEQSEQDVKILFYFLKHQSIKNNVIHF